MVVPVKKGRIMPDLWIEVDLDAIKHNYRQVASLLSPGCRIMAVIKADGYGMGAVQVARVLQEEGCGAFAVTTVAEALNLRSHGIESSILVLGPSGPEDWEAALTEGIELTVSRLAWISDLEKIAEEKGSSAKIHLKLETGMGRTGFTRSMLEDLARALHNSPCLTVAGAYSHFARAAQRDHSYTRKQNERFLSAVSRLEELGIKIPLKHICNSAAFLDYPEYHYNQVRIGTLLIGHFPAPSFRGKLELQDPWKTKAKILHLQRVPKGTYVGYQSLYKSRKETTLAVIQAGYAHGFGIEPKLVPQGFVDLGKIILKNIFALWGIQLGQEKIIFKGRTVQIAGKVGMELTVLDMGETECSLGEEIELPLRRTLANPRIPRVYKKDGEYFGQRVIKEGFVSLNTEYSKSEI